MKNGAAAIHCESLDPFALCGWAALMDGLRLINGRGPIRPLPKNAADALVEYVGHRRDALLHHHFPNLSFV